MEPTSIDALWALFWQRDTILIALFLGPLTALGIYAATRWGEYERFLAEHPDIASRFKVWRRRPKPPDPNACPTHHILVMRGSCPIPGCGWRPK